MVDKKKEFLVALGERNVETGTTDEILKATIAERNANKIKRSEEIEDLTHEAKVAELKRKANTTGDAGSGAGTKKEPESPVKFEVKGGVNLGTIDFDAERQRAAAELKDLKSQQDENLRTLGAQNEALRDKINAKEIEITRITNQHQIDILTKMIESYASKEDFATALTKARTIAQELGYSLPGADGGGSRDMMTEIKLKEIEFNNTMALREFDERCKDRDTQRELDLERLRDEREERKRNADREDKKFELFAKTPEVVGNAIGRYIMEGSSGGGGVEAHPGKRISSSAQQSGPGIEAGVGESGVADCINCGQQIAIGSTASMAVCAACKTKYPIVRVPLPSESNSKNNASGIEDEDEEE